MQLNLTLVVFLFFYVFLGLIIYKNYERSLTISSLLIGVSIIFKQQSIGFILGLMFYCIFFPKKKTIYLTLTSGFIWTGLYFLLLSNNLSKYYTFEVLLDDGFNDMKILLFNNYPVLRNLFLFFLQ